MTRSPFASSLLLAAGVLLPSFVQDPSKPPPGGAPANPPAGAPGKPPAGTVPAGPEGTEKKDDKEAAKQPPIEDNTGDAVKTLKEQQKALADKDPKARADALKPFVVHRNEAYAAAILPLLKDKDASVQLAAIQALGNQPYPKAIEGLLDFATTTKPAAPATDLLAAAVRALGEIGMGKRGYPRLREIFDAADPRVKKEIIDACVKQKEKDSFSLLVDWCDEPKGDTSAANPYPASYYEKRFKEWSVFKASVRRGLTTLTGESYATAKQYMEWANGPGKKKGFHYGPGK